MTRTLHVSRAIAIPGYAARVSVRAGSVIAHPASLNRDGPKRPSISSSDAALQPAFPDIGRGMQQFYLPSVGSAGLGELSHLGKQCQLSLSSEYYAFRRKSAYADLQRPRVGRKARANETVQETLPLELVE